MHKIKSIFENEIKKILWGFKTQADHLNSSQTESQISSYKKKKKKKKNVPFGRFCRSDGSLSENDKKQKDRQILRRCHRIKKKL